MQNRRRCFIVVAFLFVFCVSFSGNSLRQGQAIKQFYTYGMTKALVENGFCVYSTYLPCTDERDGSFPRRWAEEPPIFSGFAALLARLGAPEPRWSSIFVALAFSLLAVWLLLKFHPRENQVLWLIMLSLMVPIFPRHYYQHMPDLMATMWVLCSVLAYLYQREFLFVAFLILATTTKAYAAFASVALLTYAYVFEPYQRERRLAVGGALRVCVYTLVVCFPFALYVYLLNKHGIPNPYDFRAGLSNRHSGAWGTIFTKRFLDFFLTYVGTKGVGWIVFVGFLWSASRLRKNWREQDRLHGLLWAWAFSFIPFWLLVRDASLIHDHYVLQYFFPMAVLGAEAILSIPKPAVRYLLIFVSVGIGLSNPISWRRQAGDARPDNYCGSEVHSLMKFPLPPKP